jgi:hypothetical protein
VKIIFLDIDGVLNDHSPMCNGYCGIEPLRVAFLNRILHAVPDAKIVVHSAWRYLLYEGNLPIRFFENLLLTHGVDCFGRLHGRTRWDGPGDGFLDRAAQIREYVAEHGVERFAVLDDLELPIENFVRTDSNVGLTGTDADRAIAILRDGGART